MMQDFYVKDIVRATGGTLLCGSEEVCTETVSTDSNHIGEKCLFVPIIGERVDAHQFIDGAIVAQLGVPDMKLTIQYALVYPKRRPMKGNRIDFKALGSISFDEPDTDTFKGLEFAKMAGRKGGNMPTVFNAANEKAVALFLDNKIKFLDIYDIIWDCMENATFIENPDVDEILKTEQWCYDFIDKR